MTLPASIPTANQFYDFRAFGLSSGEVQAYGPEGAVNHALEVAFCPFGQENVITLKERGPGLEAVVDVLRKYNSEYWGNAVLQKWVFDLTEAALRASGMVRS